MSSDMSAEPPSTAAAARSGRYDCPACAAAFNRRQLLRRDLSTGNRWYGKDMGYACPHCKTPLRSRYAASATYIGVTMTWALALLMLQIWKPKKPLRLWLIGAVTLGFLAFLCICIWRERNDRRAFERHPEFV